MVTTCRPFLASSLTADSFVNFKLESSNRIYPKVGGPLLVRTGAITVITRKTSFQHHSPTLIVRCFETTKSKPFAVPKGATGLVYLHEGFTFMLNFRGVQSTNAQKTSPGDTSNWYIWYIHLLAYYKKLTAIFQLPHKPFNASLASGLFSVSDLQSSRQFVFLR